MSSAAAISAGWCGTLCAAGGALRAARALLSTATAMRLAIHLMAGLLLAAAAALLP